MPKEKKSLKEYDFKEDVKEQVRPVINLVINGNIPGAEKAIARDILRMMDDIEKGHTSPQKVDDYCLLLDIYFTDYLKEINISEGLGCLLTEGMSFHDYNTEYGPDIKYIRELAEKILERPEESIDKKLGIVS